MNVRRLPNPIPYPDALTLQEQAVNTILDGSGEETLFLLEHEPVFTIGRRRDQSSLRDTASLPAPVFEINRGGQATYHGPASSSATRSSICETAVRTSTSTCANSRSR